MPVGGRRQGEKTSLLFSFFFSGKVKQVQKSKTALTLSRGRSDRPPSKNWRRNFSDALPSPKITFFPLSLLLLLSYGKKRERDASVYTQSVASPLSYAAPYAASASVYARIEKMRRRPFSVRPTRERIKVASTSRGKK